VSIIVDFVGRVALDFFDLADVVVEQLRHRGGRSNLVDQLGRATLSIVNNIAEGAGKFSKPDESAAMLDVCLRRQLIAVEAHDRGKQLLDRIVAMLVKLCRALRDA
jgi:hypothetical protein